ncbi:hypothetical protein [Psychrobacter sp. AOP7-B1-24]|uniref:hypothetical protein n=1 Tax=Psychrobacter sp. AOP7-B1-24 TaxID=3457645 RepID=UPI00402B9921
MEDEQEKNGLISKREKPVVSELYSFSEEIKNRESWAKIVIAIILTALVSYKIAIADINLDFSNFNFSFTDLLSLILAIFAISMSVAFYFKATDTSNKFYDNTFKFTKDISEILGRIEAGFGARLKNLDEGYSGLRDRFENGSSNSEELDSNKIELEKEKEKLKQEVSEKDDILSDLMSKAELNENERTEVLNSLKSKEKEISNLSNQLQFLKREINNSERSIENHLLHKAPPTIKSLIINIMMSSGVPIDKIIDAPVSWLQKKIILDKNKYSRFIFEDLFKYGVIDEEGVFTKEGLHYIKSIVKRM